MVQNDSKSNSPSNLNKGLSSSFWKVEKKNVWCECKSVFKLRTFTNEREIGLIQQAWVEKTVHEVETHWLSNKEKVSVAIVL